MVDDHIFHFIILLPMVDERLISVSDHKIVLDLALAFFDLLLEQNGVGACRNLDASSLIRPELVLLLRLS